MKKNTTKTGNSTRSAHKATDHYVEISRKFTEQEMKIWHMLLAHAQPNFATQELHTIALSVVYEALPQCTNEEELMMALINLIINVTYKTVALDGRLYEGGFVLLSGGSINPNNDTFSYRYTSAFKTVDFYPEVASYLSKRGLLSQQSTDYSPAMS